MLRLISDLRVKRMMTHQEVHQQLPDYVLGLLSPQQADDVAQHLVVCTKCQQEASAERDLENMIRQTLNIATQPEGTRLKDLRPTIPSRRARQWLPNPARWHLAPAVGLLLLIAGLLFLGAPNPQQPFSLMAPATATATSTNTPTATIAQEPGSDPRDKQDLEHEAELLSPILPQTNPVPLPSAPSVNPQPTPIAALNTLAAN